MKTKISVLIFYFTGHCIKIVKLVLITGVAREIRKTTVLPECTSEHKRESQTNGNAGAINRIQISNC